MIYRLLSVDCGAWRVDVEMLEASEGSSSPLSWVTGVTEIQKTTYTPLPPQLGRRYCSKECFEWVKSLTPCWCWKVLRVGIALDLLALTRPHRHLDVVPGKFSLPPNFVWRCWNFERNIKVRNIFELHLFRSTQINLQKILSLKKQTEFWGNWMEVN